MSRPLGGGGGINGSGAGPRRPAERTMDCARRGGGAIVTAERSSRTEHRRRVTAPPIHHPEQQQQQTDMETDCGPEDVIRWWSVNKDDNVEDDDGDDEEANQCRLKRRRRSRRTSDGENRSDREIAGVAAVGHGKSEGKGDLFSGSSVHSVMHYRQQRDDESDTEEQECCATRTKTTRQQHYYLGAAAMPRRSLLVTVLLCAYLTLSSLTTVAFAGRQQDGEWPSFTIVIDTGWPGTMHSGRQQSVQSKSPFQMK